MNDTFETVRSIIRSLLLISFFVLTPIAEASEPASYTSKLKDRLLNLHAFANYVHHPEWNNLWEKGRLTSNGIRFSFGSVETNDLLCDYQLNVNLPLSSGWMFRMQQEWYAGQQVKEEITMLFLGLERRIWGPLAIFAELQPAFNKETVDFRGGLSLSDKDQVHYLRVAYRHDDFTYDEKNSVGGKTTKKPRGLDWWLRAGNTRYWMYSEGHYTTGFRRIFPDSNLSPLLQSHQKQSGYGHLNFYSRIRDNQLAVLAYRHYQFKEAKTYSDKAGDYDFRHTIHLAALKYIWQVTPRHGLRFICRYLWSDTQNEADGTLYFERREWLPAVFYEYRSGNMIWELGYMGSRYEWEEEVNSHQPLSRKKNYLEKLKLGWTYRLNEHCRLQFSLSHVLSIWGFGGANSQFIYMF